MSLKSGIPLSTCSSTVRESPPMTAVVPLAIANSVTRRCTSITGYFAEIVPSSASDAVPDSTHPFCDEIVGTIDTLMSPLVPMRGVTSSDMPQLKNASFANIILSSPGIAAICMSRSRESPPEFVVRFAAILTFGYFVVMSTVAFFPDETMILGLENMRASWLPSSAERITYICEKSSVPLK